MKMHLFCAAFLAAMATTALSEDNPVQNPGFEDGDFILQQQCLPGWKARIFTPPGEVIYSLDTENPHSGTRCLKIHIPSSRQRTAKVESTALYPVKPGVRIVLSFFYKSVHKGGGAESAMWIELYDSNKKEMSTSSAKRCPLKQTADWKKYTAVFQVPDNDSAGYYVGFFFRHINPGTFWVDDISFQIKPDLGNFNSNAPNIEPPAEIAIPEKNKSEAKVFVDKDGFKAERTADGLFKLTAQGKFCIVNPHDGAVATAISDTPVSYPGHGQGGLFRDIFWAPAEARWNSDAYSPYKYDLSKMEEDGCMVSKFSRILSCPPLAGMRLTKTYKLHKNLDKLEVYVSLANNTAAPLEFSYYSWNRFENKGTAPDIAIQGETPLPLADKNSNSHIFLRPRFTSFVKVANSFYLGWQHACPIEGGTFLDRMHLWNNNYPSIGLIGKPITLEPKKKFLIKIRFNTVPPQQPVIAPSSGDFRLEHGYSINKPHYGRASIHNHSQYVPTYTHAPVPTPDLLKIYRDKECKPKYIAAAITEHGRLTLPGNSEPKCPENPPFGVDNMLFIPGGELTLGSHYGTVPGDMFAEINCVGLNTASTDITNQNSFIHKKISAYKAEDYLDNIIKSGAYVGLCHPNCQLDGEGVQRWLTSGYNLDELDVIFGNPEKRLPPFKTLPLGLEIGNQGYDFTARSAFKNAEEKWDALLARGFRLHGTCSDDTHGKPRCGGWIAIYLDELTIADFMKNLIKGNFYASQGPEITDIKIAGKTFTVSTDIPATIQFIGKGGQILHTEKDATTASYIIKGDEIYVRAKITRECPEVGFKVDGGIGYTRSAWTNPVYIAK